MRSKKLFKTVASFALITAMVAPVLLSPAAPAKAAMKFNKKSLILATGESKKIKIKGFKAGSSAVWKTSSAKVASISGSGKNGTVKAVGAGSAKITCKVAGKTVSGLTVKVRQKVNSFAMQDKDNKAKTSADLTAGDTLILKGAINGNSTGSTTNQTVTWTSSNKTVASVAKTNVNTAKVTARTAGTATITAVVAPKSKTDKKTVSCTIKVTGKTSTKTVTSTTTKQNPQGNSNKSNGNNNSSSKTNAKPTATPWKYSDSSIIYKQHYDVTRWYNPDTTGSINGHKHDGYKNNTFAIWMVGFFDNEYSSNEAALDTFGGPELDDYKGTPLNVSGQFQYEGTAQKTILFQINYTSPSDYPILWKWEKGASARANEYAKELNISGVNGEENLAPKTWKKMNITFTIPKNAKNGDKDDSTGKNYGIYLYFPNKPGGALAFVKDNTFHFKDFIIKKK